MSGFIEESLAVLSRTPSSLDALLRGLPDAWTTATEGPGTWSPLIVLGHLVHVEQTDWMPRLEIILKHGENRPFDPVDREAQFQDHRPISELLDEFGALRRVSLNRLRGLDLQEDQLALTGMHPTLGIVTARQLLATWTAHDLAHLVQVSRVMAKRLREETGPWASFLSVMR